MAATVEGANLVGTTSNGVPMVQGSDNLIKINIDRPVAIDLKTFKDNIAPYLEGDNNIVEVDISGGDNYISDIVLKKNKLILTKNTVNGEEVEEIGLPYATDGTLESCEYIISEDKIKTSWSKVHGVEKEPWEEVVWGREYNVIKDNAGSIISITREE